MHLLIYCKKKENLIVYFATLCYEIAYEKNLFLYIL